MVFYNVIFPIIITIIIGTPLAIYAGIVAGRILVFYQLKSECLEVINMYCGPFYSSNDVKVSERNFEGRMTSLIDKLENLGHSSSAECVGTVYREMTFELGEIETSFAWSEARQRNEPQDIINVAKYNEWYKKIDLITPSLRSLLKPSFKV